jgi:hypothetical protein
MSDYLKEVLGLEMAVDAHVEPSFTYKFEKE